MLSGDGASYTLDGSRNNGAYPANKEYPEPDGTN